MVVVVLAVLEAGLEVDEAEGEEAAVEEEEERGVISSKALLNTSLVSALCSFSMLLFIICSPFSLIVPFPHCRDGIVESHL